MNTLAPYMLTALIGRPDRQAPAPQARDPAFQDQLMDRLAALSGVSLV